jgi:hexosaminidase
MLALMMFNTRTYAFCFGLLALAFHPLASIAQSLSNAFDLIPYPQTLEPGEGNFTVTAQTKISTAPRFTREAVQLTWILQQGLGATLPPVSTLRPSPALRSVSTHSLADDAAGPKISLEYDAHVTLPEAYVLIIDSRHVILRAREAAGIFHGIETIRQLLPAAAEKGRIGDRLFLPAVRIEDHPAYAWRGMHLDVARHFFSIAYLRKMIDRMALYKMNRLHLHLTDDQGWRIEIKKYPLLTQAGAWRSFNNQDSDCIRKAEDDPDFAIDKSHIIKRNGHLFYGGFYTQQEMRELVAFAAARHIEIIPEIDMPGHMMAAINSYPFLTCNGQNTWGELFTRPICPCNESTFEFAENIFSEIMDIFPSRYIHIGGDEVDRSDWAKSPACKVLMEREGIHDLPALQSYFISRMEKFFLSKGRKLVGWDEIIEGPISSTALVMYWRTWVKGAPLKAARNGNEIVMATGEPLYFDRPADQSDLSNIYHFIPVPGNFDSLQANLVIGRRAAFGRSNCRRKSGPIICICPG